MGPGVKRKEDFDFIPELLEIVAFLWRFSVNFTILDHNPRVIEAIENRKYGTDSNQVYGLPLSDEEKNEFLQPILSISTEISPGVRLLPLNPNHTFIKKQCNFSEFQFEICYDVIIALNSLYYLLNDDRFSGWEELFLLNVLDSCNCLFLDKIAKNLLVHFIRDKRELMITRLDDVLYKIQYK